MDRPPDPAHGLGDRERRPVSPRLVLGFAVMAVGLLLTLDNLGVLEARHFWRYWPVVLIVAGIAKAVESLREGRRPMGAGLIVIGTFLLLTNLGLISFRAFWPILILVLGASMVWKAVTGAGTARPDVADRVKDAIHSSIGRPIDSAAEGGVSSSLSAFAMMGGVRRSTNAQDFKRGDAFALMGGCELDLREAAMKDDEAVFDIFALMGGVEMRVPEDWVVDNRGFALLGGFVDKTRPVRDAKKRLILTGLALMGGVEVKN